METLIRLIVIKLHVRLMKAMLRRQLQLLIESLVSPINRVP